MFDMIMGGMADMFTLNNLIFMNIGMFAGIIFGAIPGLSANIGIMLMLPMTFAMSPSCGILMLMGVYCGGTYGGSITAILIGTPGTNVAVATVFDGYPLAKKGYPNKALTMALVASTIGGLISAFALLFTAPLISEVALLFAPPEYFALAIFGLSIIAGISGESLLRGLVASVLGYMTAMVGIDSASGAVRFAFGNIYMLKGLQLVPVLLGVFALPNVLEKILDRDFGSPMGDLTIKDSKGDRLEKSELRSSMPVIMKGTLIGVIIGAIPGAGAAIAAFIAYNEARRTHKNRTNFGHGELDGIAAPESANNAVTGASFIPLFTLGIPGSIAAAALIGAFTIHGMQVGPSLFRTQERLLYTIMFGLILVNIFMYLQGKFLSRAFAHIAKVPQILLIPGLLIFCVAGSYANANHAFDVSVMLAYGIALYYLRKIDIPGPPFVLGIILGPLAEENLKRSLVMSDGSWSIFLTRPICVAFLLITVFFTAYSIRKNREAVAELKNAAKESRAEGKEEGDD